MSKVPVIPPPYIDVLQELTGERLTLARWFPDGRLLLSFTHPGGSSSFTIAGVTVLDYNGQGYHYPDAAEALEAR